VMGKKITANDVGTDSSGKGVLFLLEEHADYYRNGDKERTIIHSVKQSGSPGSVGMSQFPDVISFYENNVDVIGGKSRGFISPVSDNALMYYKYKLEGQFIDLGKTIYKIKVTQKRAFEPCFYGTIYIADVDFAIHSLNLTLAKKAGMDIFDTLTLNQIYLPQKQDEWVIKSQVMYYTLKILGFDVTANFVTVYDKQRINERIPDSLFSKKVISSYDPSANKKDSTYWEGNRPIPLEADEVRDYVKKDSIRIVNEDPKRIDSMMRLRNRFRPLNMAFSGYSYFSKQHRYTVNPIFIGGSNILNYNLVEGFNLAPVVESRHMTDTGKSIGVDFALRYGFSNTHFNGIGRIYRNVRDINWMTREWTFGIEGGKYVFQYNPENPVLPWFNTYSALFYREIDLRLYERTEFALYFRRNYGNGLSWQIRSSWQERYPMNNATDYALLDGDKTGFKTNTPLHLRSTATFWETHKALLFSGAISWQPGFTYVEYPSLKRPLNSKWPIFSLNYQKGATGILGSGVNFDKWRFSIVDDIDLHLLGDVQYNIATGGFIKNESVAIPDLNHLFGNRGLGYATPYLHSFQFARYYEFSNKNNWFGEAHIEYHLNGLLTNKIPLFRKLNWFLVLGGNSYYAGDALYYHEAFVGLDNIGFKVARLLRVDFVQSWDSNGGRNSGIRVGLNTSSFSLRKNFADSEW